jgi:hypothetical protein
MPDEKKQLGVRCPWPLQFGMREDSVWTLPGGSRKVNEWSLEA